MSLHIELVHEKRDSVAAGSTISLDLCPKKKKYPYSWATSDQTNHTDSRFVFESMESARQFLRDNKFFTCFFLDQDEEQEPPRPDFKEMDVYKCGKADEGCPAQIVLGSCTLCCCSRDPENPPAEKKKCDKSLEDMVLVFGCFEHTHGEKKRAKLLLLLAALLTIMMSPPQQQFPPVPSPRCPKSVTPEALLLPKTQIGRLCP